MNRAAAEYTDAGETVALVTVTEVDGSVPSDPGATMLVRADGSTEGIIGGGTVEDLTRGAALERLHAPVGIEVGGGPTDVALSILAQLNRVGDGLSPDVGGE